MGKLIDLSGKEFGKLTVLKRAPNKGKSPCWVCSCKCGNITTVHGTLLRGNHTKSCGCLRQEVRTALNMTHGENIRGRRSPEYEAWSGMLNRCKPTHKHYEHYGARGIRVCEEWNSSFMLFLEHIGRKPTPQHSLDRINNDGNYEPGNVRWATKSEQMSNRRRWNWSDSVKAEFNRRNGYKKTT